MFLVCSEGDWRLIEVMLTVHLCTVTRIYNWIFLSEMPYVVKGQVVELLQYCSMLWRMGQMWFHVLFSGTSWLLLCSLLGSSLPSCFGHLICVADFVYYQFIKVLLKTLYIKRSHYWPLPWVLEGGRPIFLMNAWLLDDWLSLSFSCLDFPFFTFYLMVYTLFARYFEHVSACESILTAAYSLWCFLCFYWQTALKFQSQLRYQLSLSFNGSQMN